MATNIDPKQISDIREMVKEAQNTLKNVENMLAKIIGENSNPLPDWMGDRLKVWKEIDSRGGVVEHNEYIKILDKVGYDHRGAGGFFRGEKPSLTLLAGDRIALTPIAKEYLEQYKDYLDDL